MSGIHISFGTQSDVRSFFYQNRISSEAQKEILQFMQLVSPSIKQKIAQVILIEPLSQNALIKGI